MIWINELFLIVPIVFIFVFAALYFMLRADLKTWCPEYDIFIKARKDKLPVLFLRNPGTNVCKPYLGVIEEDTCWFDLPGLGIHFSPQHIGHTAPDLLNGDMVVYHGVVLSPELMSPENAVALSQLSRVRDEYEVLRSIRNQDLHALLSCPAEHLERNCRVLFDQNVFNDDTIPVMVPESVEEFIELVTEVRDVLSGLELYHADYIGETYESVKKILSVEVVAKTFWQKFLGFLFRKKTDTKEEEQDFSFEYKYVNYKRKPIGIQLFSYADAVQNLSSAYNSMHAMQLKLYTEAKTKMNMLHDKNEMIKWIFIGSFAIAIVLISAGVAYMMISGGS